MDAVGAVGSGPQHFGKRVYCRVQETLPISKKRDSAHSTYLWSAFTRPKENPLCQGAWQFGGGGGGGQQPNGSAACEPACLQVCVLNAPFPAGGSRDVIPVGRQTGPGPCTSTRHSRFSNETKAAVSLRALLMCFHMCSAVHCVKSCVGIPTPLLLFPTDLLS